jgi:hypothetical protein
MECSYFSVSRPLFVSEVARLRGCRVLKASSFHKNWRIDVNDHRAPRMRHDNQSLLELVPAKLREELMEGCRK